MNDEHKTKGKKMTNKDLNKIAKAFQMIEPTSDLISKAYFSAEPKTTKELAKLDRIMKIRNELEKELSDVVFSEVIERVFNA